MTTSRTSSKRTTASNSRARATRAASGQAKRTSSQKSGSSSTSRTSRKTAKTSKQAAAKTTSAKRTGAAATAKKADKATATKGAARGSARGGSVTATETVDMVRELASVVEHHSLSELVIDLPGATLTLRRAASGDAAPAAAAPAIPATAAVPQAPIMPAAAPPQAPAPKEPGGGGAAPTAESKADDRPPAHQVTSPFVGTFYRSPNPDAPAYVDVGSRVEKGQPLCIVEAMKLMNEIEADQAGVIRSILVENAEPVEYGQPLFEIAPE